MKEIIARVNLHKPAKLPTNSSDPLIGPPTESPVKVTVRQFVLALLDLSAAHGLTNSAVNDILKLLRDSIPNIILPLSAKDSIPYSDKNVTSNTMKKYAKVDLKDFPTDICRRECMAFRGWQFIGTNPVAQDCSKLLHCLICGDARFTKCGHKTCIKNQTEFVCNPYAKDGKKKAHSVLYRFAMRSMYCRSIIIKLIELYCLSLLEGFEGILDYDNRRVKKDGKIIDILDGTEVKRQKKIMSRRFERYRKTFR